MPGLKVVVGSTATPLPSAPEPEALTPEVRRRRHPVFAAPGVDVSFDVPEDYPSFRADREDFLLFVEGLVYDRTDAQLVDLGATLARRLGEAAPLDAPVLDFIRSTDGEFVVLLVDRRSGTLVAFNDRWGRLPLYCAAPGGQLVVSREPLAILSHLPAARIDREALAEWLAFEYTLSPRWFVAGVERVEPATLLVASATATGARFERRVLEARDLTATEPLGDAPAAARRYAELYLAGYAERARKLAEQGYRLMSDLSGGFDSRMVFAGARRLGLPVEFYSDHLVSGDESEVALRLGEVCGGQVTRVGRPEFVRDAAEWRRWTYLSGGRVNVATMMGALLVTRSRRATVPGRAVRFMGFAGEPIRQPPLPAGGFGGFAGALTADVYTRYIGLRDGCRLLGLEWDGFRRHLQDAVARWPERDFTGRCRRFDRLRDLGTVHAGEDRHRWYFWTVTPMWSNAVLDFAYRHIGARLSNLAFFVEMLRAVYPKVLEVPLHQRPHRLDSRLDTGARSAWGDLVTRVRQHRWVRGVRRALRYPEKWAERPTGEERAWIREQVAAAFRESAAVRTVFQESVALGYLETQQATHRLYQVLTAVWFVAEVDRRFPDLFFGPWGA